MTTAFDTRMAAAVTRILNKLGTTATLHSVTRGVYDPFGGTRAPDTTSDQPVKASPPMDFVTARNQGFVSGSSGSDVLPTDLFTILDTVQTDGSTTVSTPAPETDRLTIAGVRYAVREVWDIRSGDDTAAWGVRVRKS